MEEPLAPARVRIEGIDVARGFALFGILVVNVQTFGGPFPWAQPDPWNHGVDRMVYAVTDALFASKFFPLFGLLFGVSARLQLDAIEARGGSPGRFFARRMAGLFAIGLVHAALLSTIDILVQYALLGLLLPLFRKLRDRTLVAIALVSLAVPVLIVLRLLATGALVKTFGRLPPAEPMIAAYGRGDLATLFARRAKDLAGYYGWFASYSGWVMLATLTLGHTQRAAELVRDLPSSLDALRRIRRLGLGVGLPLAAVHASAFLHFKDHGPRDLWVFPAMSLSAYGAEPGLALAYAASVLLFARSGRLPRMASALARMGRLSLTQYVGQSVVMNLVFFSFGLGLYGRVRPLALLGFVALTYGAQLLFARAWLVRWEQGPLEALWRRLTYGRPASNG